SYSSPPSSPHCSCSPWSASSSESGATRSKQRARRPAGPQPPVQARAPIQQSGSPSGKTGHLKLSYSPPAASSFLSPLSLFQQTATGRGFYVERDPRGCCGSERLMLSLPAAVQAAIAPTPP